MASYLEIGKEFMPNFKGYVSKLSDRFLTSAGTKKINLKSIEYVPDTGATLRVAEKPMLSAVDALKVASDTNKSLIKNASQDFASRAEQLRGITDKKTIMQEIQKLNEEIATIERRCNAIAPNQLGERVPYDSVFNPDTGERIQSYYGEYNDKMKLVEELKNKLL